MRHINSFDQMMNDIITVVHGDGSKHEGIRASVQREKIITFDVTVPLSTGDKINRELPSGQTEVLIVTDVHLAKGLHSIPDSYKIEYEREGALQRPTQPTTVNVKVSDSPQTRVNLNAADNSTNTINTSAVNVFSQIRDLLGKSVDDAEELELLLERVNDMEHSLGSSNFIEAYQDFIAAAAAHMTILAPLLPPLTSLLTSAGG